MTGSGLYEYYMSRWNPTFSEWVFLPPWVHWEDLDKPEFAHVGDLLKWTIPATALVLFVRYLLEFQFFWAFGYKLGIKKVSTHYVPNPVLEAHFQQKGPRVSSKTLTRLIKETGMEEREIHRWLRRRAREGKSPPIRKFAEALFKFVFYSFSFTFGMVLLWYRPWLWDIQECWRNLPFHPVDTGSFVYYVIQSAYYLSCTITLPFDNKRKDFNELIVHHVATLALLFFSYAVNFWRVGTLVMVIHDVADIVLEGAKSLNYSGFDLPATIGFVAFAITFLVSRLIMFPFVINSALNDTCRMYFRESLWDYVINAHFIPTHLFFCLLLCVLLSLHVFWFTIIVRMAIKLIFNENKVVEKDERSDHEFLSDSDKEVPLHEDDDDHHDGDTKKTN